MHKSVYRYMKEANSLFDNWPLTWQRRQDLNLRPLGYEPNDMRFCSFRTRPHVLRSGHAVMARVLSGSSYVD